MLGLSPEQAEQAAEQGLMLAINDTLLLDELINYRWPGPHRGFVGRWAAAVLLILRHPSHEAKSPARPYGDGDPLPPQLLQEERYEKERT